MKQLISRRSFLKAAGVTAAAASMAIGAPAASACWLGDKSDVTILYTNDVHTYIDKQSPKLTYAAIADLKQSYQNAGKDVLLVDAGDHVQGTAYGSMDEGASIIKLMNAAGYDAATPGNHEFDYGMDRAKAIMKEADFPYLSCNWVDLRTGLRVLPSVKVFVRGGRRIAFVGVTTPETFTKSTPAYFMDKAQRKYIYDIQGGEDGKKLYDAVQKAIDKAKLLADVVIGLGHLGVDPSSSPWTSEEVIAHTSGFDAFIDGHSHTVMENKQVQDASGKAVTLTQTGSYFANVGEMTIAADGTITTKLIPTHEGMDAGIAAMQTSWVNTVDDMSGLIIRIPDSSTYKETFTQLGAAPTPVAWGETYTALDTGLVSAVENIPESIMSASMQEVCKYVNVSNHIIGPTTISVSEQVFQKLTEEQQNILTEAAKEACEFGLNATKDGSDANFDALEGAGLEVVDTDVDSLKAKINYNAYACAKTDVGKQILTSMGVAL